eukprot:7235568-Pyramimonas_sp.AAC.1
MQRIARDSATMRSININKSGFRAPEVNTSFERQPSVSRVEGLGSAEELVTKDWTTSLPSLLQMINAGRLSAEEQRDLWNNRRRPQHAV